MTIMVLDIEQHTAHMFLVFWCQQTTAWLIACQLHDSVCMQWCTWPLIPIINSTTGLCVAILCICIVLSECDSTYKTSWPEDSVLCSTGKAACHVCPPALDCTEVEPSDYSLWHRFSLWKYALWCSPKGSRPVMHVSVVRQWMIVLLRLRDGKPCCWKVTEAEIGCCDPVSSSPSLEPLPSNPVRSKTSHKGAELSLMLGPPQRLGKGWPLLQWNSVTCPCVVVITATFRKPKRT